MTMCKLFVLDKNTCIITTVCKLFVLDRNCKVKLATVVEGDQKASFSIATTQKGGGYSFPVIALLYPWYIPYIAEC